MKCIKAIVRPEKEQDVIKGLEEAGIAGLTRWDVLGRGRQRGIQVGHAFYGELPKVCLMVIVEDAAAGTAISAITARAQTGQPGDGRIFVSEVAESYTIRTGKADF